MRLGVLHIDMPIAVGIVGAYVGSLYGWLTGRDRFVYFDFVAAFILLMLVGRWAQVAAVERNRRRLLSLQSRPQLVRLAGAGLPEVRDVAPEKLKVGDRFLNSAGQTVPVDARLTAGETVFSLASINGESEPRVFRAGQRVPAGHRRHDLGQRAQYAVAHRKKGDPADGQHDHGDPGKGEEEDREDRLRGAVDLQRMIVAGPGQGSEIRRNRGQLGIQIEHGHEARPAADRQHRQQGGDDGADQKTNRPIAHAQITLPVDRSPPALVSPHSARKEPSFSGVSVALDQAQHRKCTIRGVPGGIFRDGWSAQGQALRTRMPRSAASMPIGPVVAPKRRNPQMTASSVR